MPPRLQHDGVSKRCPRCGDTRPVGCFGKNRQASDGLQTYCKRCLADYRSANRESIRQKSRAYWAANASDINLKRRDEYAAEPEAIRAANRDYYARNADTIKQQKREYRAENFEAIRAANRRWRAANVDKKWNADLYRNYGLTLEEFNAILDRQGGKCAIEGCGHTPSDRRLAVDHDHSCCSSSKSCGKCVRGVICTNCNSALGMVNDDPARLMGLIRYLSKSRERAA